MIYSMFLSQRNDRDIFYFFRAGEEECENPHPPKSKSFCDVEINDQVVFFSTPPQFRSSSLLDFNSLTHFSRNGRQFH